MSLNVKCRVLNDGLTIRVDRFGQVQVVTEPTYFRSRTPVPPSTSGEYVVTSLAGRER